MGISLQDQLLQAGLVSKEKANKAKKQNKKQVRQKRNVKVAAPSAADVQRQKERDEKLQKDRELNERRNEARKQREIAAQIKQLVSNNRHAHGNSEDDVPFYFDNKGKVKQLYVSEPTHKMIAAGQLVIVNANGIFELVAPDIAEKIRQRNPSLVIDLPKEQESTADDPYADFEVPDDLMW